LDAQRASSFLYDRVGIRLRSKSEQEEREKSRENGYVGKGKNKRALPGKEEAGSAISKD